MSLIVKIFGQTILMTLFIFSLFAEDQKQSITLIDLEITGTLIDRKQDDQSNELPKYQIKTNLNQYILLPIQDSEKNINLSLFLNKEVIVKGKGNIIYKMTTTSCQEIISLVKYTSIELNPAAEKKIKDKSKQKDDLIDIEVYGILSEVTRKGNSGSNYSIVTAEKQITYLTNQIGEKEINLELLIGKIVIAKGKGILHNGANHITQLTSIELKSSAPERKKDLGNQSKD